MNNSQEPNVTRNKFNSKNTFLKSFVSKYKIYPSNKKVISISKEQEESSSSDLDIISSDNQNTNFINDNNTSYECEDNEEEEEEELNSDEYVSSTNLDVETNTYIKLTDTTKSNNNEKELSNICGEKEISYPGKIRNKIKNKKINKKVKKIKENGVCNIFLNNKEMINKNNDVNYVSHNKKYKKKNNNKSGIFIHPPKSRNVENKNNSNTQEKKFVFTPDNGAKKSLKVLREMLVKKLDHLNSKNMGTTPQSHTMNMIDAKNNNNLITFNSKLIKNDLKLNLHQRNKTAKITINNSINKNNSIDNKNISTNEMLKINQTNKIKNNILKEINEQNADNKKYQTSKKLMTAGKFDKNVNNKRHNRNENLYLKNNNNKSINKTVNNPLNANHKYYKKINGVSSSNYSDINKFSSIHSCKKDDNFHSLKNLKTQNIKKNIKKFIFDDEFLTIIPFAIDKNVKNEKEKEKIKTTKDSKNKKNNKNQNNKNNNLNINKYKIKRIIPLNIKSHKNQLRYFNSFYPKKIKQNIFNKIANEQILTTISNDFRNNKKIEIFKNINSNIDLNQNKYNLSDKKYKREKSSSKNKELSLNLTTENYIKNLLAFRKLRNLKNKNFKSSDFNNENNNINNNIKKENLTTRIKIDLINVEKNNAKKYVTRNNNIINSNNETIHTTVNSNSINSNKYKKIKKIYLDNTTYKALPYKCVSPNCQSIKKIMDGKKNVSKLKQIYNNKLKPNNKGRNNYNIYFDSNQYYY